MNRVTLISILLGSALESSAITDMTCGFDVWNPRCPDGKVIDISEATYGRTVDAVCGKEGEADAEPLNSILMTADCVPRDAPEAMEDCQGMNTCTIRVDHRMVFSQPGVPGADPCPNIRKYLLVTYECVTPCTTDDDCLGERPVATCGEDGLCTGEYLCDTDADCIDIDPDLVCTANGICDYCSNSVDCDNLNDLCIATMPNSKCLDLTGPTGLTGPEGPVGDRGPIGPPGELGILGMKTFVAIGAPLILGIVFVGGLLLGIIDSPSSYSHRSDQDFQVLPESLSYL